jgi:hypothetical protein
LESIKNLLLPSGMADSLWMRLRDVTWDQYPCNPGTVKKVPKILENMASRKAPRAMKASHELWAALCSGSIAPAAEPCIPFLIEIIDISATGVKSEILDILLKCAQVPDGDDVSQARHKRIILAIQREQFFLTKLMRSNDAITAEKAEELINVIHLA